MVYLAIEFLISCVASFAVFFPSLKTLIEETDRLSCLLYKRGQRSLGTCSDENKTHPHACVTGQSYLHNYKQFNNI